MPHPLKQFVRRFGRAIFAGAAVLLAGSVFFVGAGLLAKWTATAILLFALPFLCAEILPLLQNSKVLSSDAGRARLAEILPYAAVGIVTLAALYPICVFQMPVSQDHVNHYFGTHILAHEMISSGRIFGWTDRLGTGYPFGDIYHIAPYFLTGFLHLVSFGLISLSASYAFGITVAWLVTAFAAVAWAKRIAGPWGGALAGILVALDTGGDREGGWGYAMFHGVWPQHLSTGVWLFALLALARLCEKPDTKRLGVAALLSGLCLWLHPMSALILLIAGALLIAVRRFGPQQRTGAGKSLVPLVAALFAAGVIGLAWIGRMMLHGDVVYAFSSKWEPLAKLMTALLNGELFANQLAFVSPLALIGAVALLLRKKQFDLYTVLLLLVLLLAGSMDLIIASDAGLLKGGLGLIQYRRFSIPAKPLFYAAAGVGLSVVIRGAIDTARASRLAAMKNSLAAKVLICVIAAPFVYSMGFASAGLIKSPAARPLTLERTEDRDGLREVYQVLKQERSRCKTEPCTAVYWEKPGHGGLYPVLSFADLDYRWLPMLKLPANNFDYQGVAADVKTMARLGATVAVSKWKQKDPNLKLLVKAGRHYVYRILSSEDGRAELNGAGSFTIEEWSAERRVLTLSDTDERSVLTLLIAPYAKWRAELNQKPVSLRKRRQGRLYVTELPNIEDGRLVLTYKDTPLENLFFFSGIGVFFGACVLTVRRPRPLPALLFERIEPRASKVIAIGFVAAVLFCAAGLLIAGKIAASKYWLKGEPEGAVLKAVLHEQEPDAVEFSPSKSCVRPYTRNPRFGCSERDNTPVLVPAQRRKGALPSCLSVGIPKNGRASLTFYLPKNTSHVKGMIHLLEGDRLDAELFAGDGGEKRIKDIKKSTPFNLSVKGDRFTVLFSGKSQKACLEAVALSKHP